MTAVPFARAIIGHAHSRRLFRACVSIVAFILLWEIGARSKELFGYAFPAIGAVPPPSSVSVVLLKLMQDPSYWFSWWQSLLRVLGGFFVAMLVGIPLGLGMAMSRAFNGFIFPPFEVLRPIPPLAWTPLAIIFWPTQELSIGFITFLGAFYTIVINVLNGAKAVDNRYVLAARLMGASRWSVFKRIILPATIPSIVVGSVVGMGITWEVVVAAEMIAGGGSSIGRSSGGLGFFIWNSYVGGSYEQIIAGMISIGIAGYLSSIMIRKLGDLVMPWKTVR